MVVVVERRRETVPRVVVRVVAEHGVKGVSRVVWAVVERVYILGSRRAAVLRSVAEQRLPRLAMICRVGREGWMQGLDARVGCKGWMRGFGRKGWTRIWTAKREQARILAKLF